MLRSCLFGLLSLAALACGGDPTDTASGSPSSSASSTAAATGGGGAGGEGSASSSGAGGSMPVPCPAAGAEIDELAPCASDPGATFEVLEGCEPVVDGALHAEEWSDGTCFAVPAMGGGVDMEVRIKRAGDAVYMATSGQPTCGCGMLFYVNPDDEPGTTGDEYVISVFDDPFGVNGDMSAFDLQNGMLMPAPPPEGIVTACPGNQPTPIRYEWRLPYKALGLADGYPGAFGLAIVHADAFWPASLVRNPQGIADDANTYARLTSQEW